MTRHPSPTSTSGSPRAHGRQTWTDSPSSRSARGSQSRAVSVCLQPRRPLPSVSMRSATSWLTCPCASGFASVWVRVCVWIHGGFVWVCVGGHVCVWGCVRAVIAYPEAPLFRGGGLACHECGVAPRRHAAHRAPVPCGAGPSAVRHPSPGTTGPCSAPGAEPPRPRPGAWLLAPGPCL